jgi:threonine/homoserine/homoserine lactone efflux protein
MSWAWILSVVVFAFAMSATPGPNNTMLAASGANYGLRRTVPHILGIWISVTVILALVGTFGAKLVADPAFHAVLKWVGVAYLLYLAWRIATAVPAPRGADDGTRPAQATGKPLNMLQAAAFQLVNPKFWVMAASAIVTYVGSAGAEGSLVAALSLAVIFGLVALPSCLFWTVVGVGAARLLQTARAMQIFNWVMAALLVASLVPIVLE